jgi:hypothetical protein
MTPLNLDLFAGAAYDVERTQYQVLGGLQRARKAFARNRVYPHLSRLVKLYQGLQTILDRSSSFRNARTGEIKSINLEDRTIQYEWPEFDQDQMATIEELIRWAIPHIQETIEEGRAVYEFVEDSLELEEVGIVPSYVQEGYMLVPDRSSDQLHVLRYSLSIFTDADERYRSLKTVHCKSIEQKGVDRPPSSIKLTLVEERDDLPNPATYYFNTDVDVPYEPTMLPVVKRMLMRHLHEHGGIAGSA